ncbi:MAG: GNAT family N-acetyltransferase [Bacteroides sp.]|nr:GNAT family N-acetyltransferase [Bacteroides sp.]
MNIIIRPAEMGEASYVSYFNMTLYRQQYHFNPCFEIYALDAMAWMMHHPEGSCLFVACADNKIVGSMQVLRQDEHTAQLRWFAVDADYRGHGIGSRLMDAAKAFCQKHGYTNVYLGTIDFLTSARRLYAKYGFELTKSWENKEWMNTPLMEERWDLKEWK